MFRTTLPVLITFFFIFGATIPAVAQSGAEIITDIDGDPYFQGTDKTVEGSPILFDQWIIADLYNNSGTKYENRQIRLDTYKHQLHLKKDNGYVILDPSQIKRIEYKEKNLVFQSGFQSKEFNIPESAFVELLYSGNIHFIKFYNTKLVESTGVNPITGEDKDKYISQEQLYLIDQKGNFHKVKKLKDNHILNALDGHEKELEKFAEQHDLSFKNKADIAEILAYYETLTN